MHGLTPKDIFAGRYLLRKRLEQSRFSESWLVHNDMVGGEQVLRIYAPLDEQGCRAFRREFANAYHLAHPRLLRMDYFDVHNSRPYLVLPYFQRSSAQKMAGRLNEGEIARIMRDIGEALAFIHQPAFGVVHRDVRPESILLSDSGDYLLGVFGVGKGLQELFSNHFSEEEVAASRDTGKAYQPPEWFREEQGAAAAGVEAAADIWALGATLYELAAGRPPFGQSGGEGQRSGQELLALPPPFSLPLSNILHHCMAEEPEERPSAEKLRKMAENYLSSGQWPAEYLGDMGLNRPPERPAMAWIASYRRIAAAVLFAAIMAAGLLWAWPKLDVAGYFAGNRNLERDNAAVQPVAHRTPEENARLPERDIDIPAWEEPAETTESGSLPPSPSFQEPAVSPPPPEQKQEEGPVRKEAENTPPAPVPAPEKTPKKNTSGEQAARPGNDTAAKGPALKPQFNDAMGKWGYTDRKGNWIIWPQFEEAGPFIGGKAKVAKKGGGDVRQAYFLKPDGSLVPVEETEIVDTENNR